jgi:DNA polymerase III gamma/tau subunit
LEAKCQEYDDLVKHMQKMRNDALKRQEQLRKEADEKIAYLVTQLRTMENASSSAASSARQSPSPALANGGGGGGSGGSGAASNAAAAAAAVDLPPPVPSSNRASPAPLRSSQQKRSLSDLLQHHAEDLGGAEGLNQEVLKRWISEKERREQLERRNAELAREIREMKTATSTTNTPR